MTRQTDGKSLYEQQEERILAQSDAFISLLTKRGILGDHKIDNDIIVKICTALECDLTDIMELVPEEK